MKITIIVLGMHFHLLLSVMSSISSSLHDLVTHSKCAVLLLWIDFLDCFTFVDLLGRNREVQEVQRVKRQQKC